MCGLGLVGVSAFLESCQKSAVSAPTVNFTLDLSSSANASLTNVGGHVYSNGVIVVKSTVNTYAALSQACTHQGCTVNYSSSGNRFVCPCHGGEFDINGNVVAGPPPSSLKKYTVTQNGSILTIQG